MKTGLLTLFIFISIFGFCSADEIPVDKKKISYSFEVINIDSYPDYVFLAYPVNISEGVPNIECIELKQGKPVNLPCKFGPEPIIYAIKKEQYDPEGFKKTNENTTIVLDSVFANNKNLIPSVNILCFGYADKNVPYDGIKYQYKIESISADTVNVILEKKIKTDRKGKIIDESKGNLMIDPYDSRAQYVYFSLPLLSLVLIITVVMVRKMKK